MFWQTYISLTSGHELVLYQHNCQFDPQNRLLQRYQNVKNELEAKQNLERINSEKQNNSTGTTVGTNSTGGRKREKRNVESFQYSSQAVIRVSLLQTKYFQE